MNDGGSVLGGNQTASGGTDASNSADLKISHDDAPAVAPATPETAPTTPETAPISDTSSASTPEATSAPAATASAELPTISLNPTPSASDDPTTISLTPEPAPSSSPAPSPFSNENVLTAADNLEISNENLNEEINNAINSLSVPQDGASTDSSTPTSADDEEEHVPILPPSSGPAHIFGQEISGITDEDLSTPAAQPISTTVFPAVEAAPPAPEPTPPEPVAPTPAPAQPVQPAAPTVPYEQQFMEQLHADPNAAKPKDTSDILINPEIPVQKTRMRLIIGIVVGVLVVAILGAVAYFSISGNQPTTVQIEYPKIQPATQQALDAYGEELAKWDSTSASSTTNLKKSFGAFKSNADNDPGLADSKETLEDISNTFDEIIRILEVDSINDGMIVEWYITDGYDEALAKIQNNYAILDTDSENVQNYLQTLLDYNSITLNAVSIFNEYGCIIDMEIDPDCILLAQEQEPEIDELLTNTYNQKSEADKYLSIKLSEIAQSYNYIKGSLGQ